MTCKHDYKQTGTVMVPTGKIAVSASTTIGFIPMTNIDNPIYEIKKECLVFICNKCEKVICKPINQLPNKGEVNDDNRTY